MSLDSRLRGNDVGLIVGKFSSAARLNGSSVGTTLDQNLVCYSGIPQSMRVHRSSVEDRALSSSPDRCRIARFVPCRDDASIGFEIHNLD